jgi:glucose/arabinose dehydrogenase
VKRRTFAPVAVAVAVTALLALGGTAAAQDAAQGDAAHPRVRLVHIADLDTPTTMATRAGDTTLYVAEQGGRVVAVQDGTVVDEPVLDLEHRIEAGGEQGLLGLTFSPDGNKLFVHFTNRSGNTRVEAYDVTNTPAEPAAVDRTSRRVLLKQHQPDGNHNGGQLAFGPDGSLYLGLGDGGGAGDEGDGHASGGNGQSTRTLLGKIVRVDLAGGGGEICDRGLRNPWRFSFDRETGDLWIGDVGQGEWEEVDRLPADEICGNNLGWNIFEGDTRFRSGEVLEGVPPIAPVAVFSHERSFCSVIGGYVYRGAAIPALDGWYVFSDYCEGTLRALRIDGNGDVVQRKLGATSTQIASFGEDSKGELFVLSQDRGLFHVAAR